MLLLLLLHASQEQSEAFAKLMKVEAFMPREMGSMGKVPSVIIGLHLSPLQLAECRIGCSSSGSGPRFDEGWRVKSKSWMKGGASLWDKSLQLPNHLASFALGCNFRNSSMMDAGGCLPIYVHTS